MAHYRSILLATLLSCLVVTHVYPFSLFKDPFIGSTPADASILSALKIQQDEKCDFIKWELHMGNDETGIFEFKALYGVSLPSTNGFIGGGKLLILTGKYLAKKGTAQNPDLKVFRLTGPKLGSPLFLIKMDNNVFHFTDSSGNFKIGSGSYSYMLNKERPNPVKTSAAVSKPIQMKATALAGYFVGRTPCLDLSEQLNVPKRQECIKIKWRLKLLADSTTGMPDTYQLVSLVYPREKPRTGKWSIIKGIDGNPEATVFQLEQQGKPTLFLLKGDDNVLFFLDQEKNIPLGNRDFAYTLNRASLN
jgi:hypothetical protein